MGCGAPPEQSQPKNGIKQLSNNSMIDKIKDTKEEQVLEAQILGLNKDDRLDLDNLTKLFSRRLPDEILQKIFKTMCGSDEYIMADEFPILKKIIVAEQYKVSRPTRLSYQEVRLRVDQNISDQQILNRFNLLKSQFIDEKQLQKLISQLNMDKEQGDENQKQQDTISLNLNYQQFLEQLNQSYIDLNEEYAQTLFKIHDPQNLNTITKDQFKQIKQMLMTSFQQLKPEENKLSFSQIRAKVPEKIPDEKIWDVIRLVDESGDEQFTKSQFDYIIEMLGC
ncbi:EF-hand_domain pair [Hexamita inflata]|uniref:EF-hand domain pair n=1 Tax=Hexamita inflata TaxID=28002 RepID=A0AA86VMC8_9EUKA|nr:EF-hand domain pair [Hexamita inflata]